MQKSSNLNKKIEDHELFQVFKCIPLLIVAVILLGGCAPKADEPDAQKSSGNSAESFVSSMFAPSEEERVHSEQMKERRESMQQQNEQLQKDRLQSVQ